MRTAGSWAAGALVLVGLYATSLVNYLLFHTLIELFTITVAAGVFVIAWNARGYLRNHYLLLVGIGALCVALLDLFHTLAYKGMRVMPGASSDVATQLWVAGRSLQALSLLLAPFFIERRLPVLPAALAFATATAALFGFIYAGVFPVSYVEGEGLTSFKVVAEYVISAAFLVATALLIRKRGAFEPRVWRLMVGFLLLTAAAELAFTAYVSVYGDANLVGHFLRLIAWYLLYKAIIETGLVQPHTLLLRDLKQSEERLRAYAAALEARNQELRHSETRLRERAVDLANRNQELDAFARTVAHDLKNPLAVITTNAELVATLDGLSRTKRATLLHRISDTALHMDRIIDELLLFAEIRKGEAPRDVVDMEKLVRRVVDRYDEMIREREAELVLPDTWPDAIGYAPWVEQVWANYLSNALQHGGPRPRVELGATAERGGTVRFWVRDDGPGVPPDRQPELFVPFRQLAVERGQGHGLGLSIVHHIVDKLGGRAGFESEDGQGSVFYFSLPAPSASAACAAASRAMGTRNGEQLT
ncbi:MAG: MASE3 domain-containing protein [Gemmatimonadota bacterium]